MLLDSNIIIYAAASRDPEIHSFVLGLDLPRVSIVTRIETLGFSKLLPEDKAWLEAFFASADVLPLDETIVLRAIELRQQRKMTLGDSIIAATALVHGLQLATRNTVDFVWISNLTVVDPFSSSP